MEYFLEEDLLEIDSRLHDLFDKIAGKTFLITGATGFIGRYLIAALLNFNKTTKRPFSIVAIDNHITSQHPSIVESLKTDPNVEYIYGDAKIGAELPNKFEYIIHAAGIASPEHYLANPLQTIDVTVNATKHLLEKARSDNAKMLFFSSSEIYGEPDSRFIPTSEDYRGNVSCRGPRSCYDESKRLAETLCWIYSHYYKVKIDVVRPFNIYGPGMMPSDYRVMPNFANAIARSEEMTIYGTGKQTRTFCYVTDAIVMMFKILILGNESDVYNIGNPTPEISIFDLAQKIKNVTKTDVGIKIIEYPNKYPKDDPSRRCPNISKFTSKFNDKPMVDLDSGIEKFFNWAKKNYHTL